MKNGNTGRNHLVRILVPMVCVGVHLASSMPTEAAVRALLVGVGEFADPQIEDSSGPAADVAALKTMLVDRLGLHEDSIRTLVDADATRAAITGAIRDWLVQPPPAHDHVLFYFAGFGSRAAAGNGADAETVICPTDYVASTGASALRRDKLMALFNSLPVGTATIIIDASRAGTALRTMDGRQQELPTVHVPGTRVRFIGRSEAAPPGRSQGEIRQIELWAGGYHQRVCETSMSLAGRPVTHGVFTRMLLAGLGGEADANHDRKITLRELDAFLDRQSRSGAEGFEQRPVLHGAERDLDQPFLGVTLPATAPRCGPISASRLRIDRGLFDGIRPGQKLRLDATERGITGIVRVEHADAISAEVALAEQENELRAATAPDRIGGPDEPVDLVIMNQPGELDLRVTVDFFEAGEESLPPQAVLASIGSTPHVIVTAMPSLAHRHVVGRIAGERVEVAVALRSGRIIWQTSGSLATVVTQLSQMLEADVLCHQLERIDNPARHGEVNLRIAGGKEDFVAYTNPDQQASIRFEVDISHDGYLYLFTVDRDGTLTVLFPNAHQRDARVRAGRAIRVPPEGEDWFRVRPPAGRDLVKAIWSPAPIDMPQLSTKSLTKGFIQSVSERDSSSLLESMDRRLWGAGTKGVVNTAGTKSGAGIGSVAEFSTATIFIDTYPEKRQADQ